MAGVCSGGGLFQTVAHEFPIGGAALHAGLGLLVLPLPPAILHFLLLPRQPLWRGPPGPTYFPTPQDRAQPGRQRGRPRARRLERSSTWATPPRAVIQAVSSDTMERRTRSAQPR